MSASSNRPGADNGMSFGDLLRRHRRAARLTQEELAEASGISVRTISDLERGVRATPQAGPAGHLADALDLTGAVREAWFAAIRTQRLPRGRAAVNQAVHTAIATAPPPAFPAPILGREKEIATIEARLAAGDRVVTLAGPGGVGKTRLAAAIAARMNRTHPRPIIWVGLEGLTSHAAVLPAVARASGARESGSPSIQRIAEALAGRDALVVLDNAEHVIEAAAEVPTLLRAVPDLALLVTSREELRIAGERVVRVDPLPLPPKDAREARLAANPAVALYLRALGEAAGPDAPAPDALREAASVAWLVDGLPLALELAGAQAANLPRTTIPGLLEAAGLSALARGRRDGPGRFRTMEAAIAWSIALLPPDADRLLGLLGVFHRGFTTEAAASIAAALGRPDLISLLPALVNAQLIQSQPSGPASRLRLLEPIRMFAVERLRATGDLPAARDAHAAWCLDWAARQLPILAGPAPLPALDAIERDLPNLHAAVSHACATGNAAATLEVLAGLYRFYDARGYRAEHRAMLDEAIAAAGASDTPGLMEAVFWSAYHANILGEVAAATAGIERLRAAAAATGNPEWTARADLLQWGRDGGSPSGREKGEALLRHGLDALGDDRSGFTGAVLSMLLGVDLQERGNATAALPLLEAACASTRTAGRALDLPVPLSRLGLALLDLGRDAEAVPLFSEALGIARALDLPGIAIFPLLGLAVAGARSGDVARQRWAARALGAAESIVLGQGIAWGPYWEATVADLEQALAAALGPDQMEALRETGRESPLDDTPAD